MFLEKINGPDDVKKLAVAELPVLADQTRAAVINRVSKNIFRGMGLDYRYLEEGNDAVKLVEALRGVKDIDHPVVLHIHTVKGKGLPYAEKNREQWHGGGPFHVEDGSPLYPGGGGENVVYTCLTELMDSNPRAVVLNAATPGGIGFGG